MFKVLIGQALPNGKEKASMPWSRDSKARIDIDSLSIIPFSQNQISADVGPILPVYYTSAQP